MNQQEIDRLWTAHTVNLGTGYRAMGKRGFTSALKEATAQARREALEEAAAQCDDIAADYMNDHYRDYAAGADNCAEKIRALMAQEAV